MGHGCPNTRHEKIMVLGKGRNSGEMKQRKGWDVITKASRSRTELTLGTKLDLSTCTEKNVPLTITVNEMG